MKNVLYDNKDPSALHVPNSARRWRSWDDLRLLARQPSDTAGSAADASVMKIIPDAKQGG